MSRRLDADPALTTGTCSTRAGLVRVAADRRCGQREHPVHRVHTAWPTCPDVLSDVSQRPGLLPARCAGAAADRPVALERGPRPVAAAARALVVGDHRRPGGGGPGPVARAPAGLPLSPLFHLPRAPTPQPHGGSH